MAEANGTALAIVPAAPIANASTALEPTTAEQAFWLATQLVKSGLLGRSVTKPEAAFAVILAGRELGLTAMQSLRSIHIIDGKPSLSADLMAALVLRSPVCRYFQLVESTATVARYETHRVGAERPTTMAFSMEDAKTAGVNGKDNWKKYPAAMLRARCIAALTRAVYPDLLMGIYESDELPQPSTMPSQREAGPIAQVEEMAEDPGVDVAVAVKWCGRLDAANDLESLDAVRTECKAEVTDPATLADIAKTYKACKARLEGK